MVKRLSALVALLICAAVLLTGCAAVDEGDQGEPEATIAPLTEPMYTDREALYQYYNQVSIGDKLDDLKEKFGEPQVEQNDNGDIYNWVMDDGYGFTAIFFDSGRLRAKLLHYDDPRQLGALSAATNIEGYASLSTSYTYEMTCGLMGGRSMELMQVAQDTSTDPEVKRLFLWSNEAGDLVQVFFSGDEKLESVNYTLAAQ